MGLIRLSYRLPGQVCNLRGNKVLTPLLTFRRCPSPSHPHLSFMVSSVFPCLLFPRRKKTCLSLEQKSQITNTCIFLSPQPRAFQYARDYYLTFSIIHLFSFFPISCFHSAPGSVYLLCSHFSPLALKSSIHIMTCTVCQDMQ